MRFDPGVPWPNDLHCTVQANPALKAFDGTRLRQSTMRPLQFVTSSLNMFGGDISSEMAEKATDGGWSASVGNEREGECPSDCLMSVSFDHPIDRDMISSALCVREAGQREAGECRPITLAPGRAGDMEIQVSFPSLKFDTAYQLELPVGTRISNISGPTSGLLQLPLHGLRPFTFIWLPPWTHISAYHERLFVRHGLPASTDLKKLAASIVISAVPSEGFLGLPELVRVSATELLVTSEAFTPGEDCLLSVTANAEVKDGFGLSLQPSVGSYSGAPQHPFVSSAPPHYVAPT